MPKQPKFRSDPVPTKIPRFRSPGFAGGHLAWRFGRADRGGPWPWSAVDRATLPEVIAKLGSFETMPEHELRSGGSHPVELSTLSRAAIGRLQELQQDDLDFLFSFRLSGANRVWCIQDASVMHVLWWDPRHEVCPSLLRNT